MCRQVFKSLQVPNSLLVLLILRMYDTSLPPPLAVFLSPHLCRPSLLLSFCLFLPNSLTLSRDLLLHYQGLPLSPSPFLRVEGPQCPFCGPDFVCLHTCVWKRKLHASMWVSEVSNNPAQANASAEICSSMQLLTQHYYSQEKNLREQ